MGANASFRMSLFFILLLLPSLVFHNRECFFMLQSRFRQADKEAGVTLILYAAFFLWWTVGAFGLGRYAQVPVFGMPAWFFVSCVLGYPMICVALWLVVRRVFVDMPLDSVESPLRPSAESFASPSDSASTASETSPTAEERP